MSLLRSVAAQRLKREWLQRWWCKRYNRPRHERLDDYTMEELMVEYLEDAIEMDPGEAFPLHVLENGIQFRGTGDAVIDELEKQIATGKSPDLAKHFGQTFASEEDRKIFEAWLKPKKKPGGGSTPPPVAVQPVPEPVLDAEGEEVPDWVKDLGDGFTDNYNTEK